MIDSVEGLAEINQQEPNRVTFVQRVWWVER